MKTIVNVYKDDGLWIKDPPGFGDYLRGCLYLEEKSATVARERSFEVRFNVDLAPASRHLEYSAVRFPADRATLAAAEEFFEPSRDGDVATVIDRFLNSEEATLFISTNAWPQRQCSHASEVSNLAAQIVNFTPEFDEVVRATTSGIPRPFVVLHIRDHNLETTAHQPTRYRRSSPEARAFRRRVDLFIDSVVNPAVPAECAVVCISNNVWLRDRLSRWYGYYNLGSVVNNTGNRGVMSEAELVDAALIKMAETVFSLSYYPWNSGFTVWLSRLFGVPAVFRNAESAMKPPVSRSC
ncbi:MAG: hypothetical protein HY826_06115 [Actinobacteria bacterium]|nr:hypothetical protein [Actinomycetota bacterium]